MRAILKKYISDYYDVIVVGAGPAGLAVAYNALKENKSVLIVERQSSLFSTPQKIDKAFLNYNQLRSNTIKAIDDLHPKKCDLLLKSQVSEIQLKEGCVTIEDKQLGFKHLILADGAAHPTAKFMKSFNFDKQRTNIAAIEENGHKVALVGDALGNPIKGFSYSLAETITGAETLNGLIKEEMTVEHYNNEINSLTKNMILRNITEEPLFEKSKVEDYGDFLLSDTSLTQKAKKKLNQFKLAIWATLFPFAPFSSSSTRQENRSDVTHNQSAGYRKLK